MAHRYDHLREKAIKLRAEQHMTLDDIIERLALPKTTIYEWIKDIPIPYTEKQSEAQRKGTEKMQAKYAALREAAYQQGLAEAPEFMKNPTFRDFVELQTYWADYLGVKAETIKPVRKSNSNQLSGRQFRSVYGLLAVNVNDTYLRSRIEAWIDYVKAQW